MIIFKRVITTVLVIQLKPWDTGPSPIIYKVAGKWTFNFCKIVILGKYLEFGHDHSVIHTSQLKQQKPSILEKKEQLTMQKIRKSRT